MKYRKILFITLTLLTLVFTKNTFADVQYQVLAPIDGYVENQNIDNGSLDKYLNGMFKLGLALCTALAVLMIVIGGVQYVSTDAWSKKSDGKERIIAALFGLLIAYGSWALLNTINPDLLKTDLKIEPLNMVEIPTDEINPNPTAGEFDNGGYIPPVANLNESEEENRAYMQANGININSAPCKEGQTTGCTNIQGLGSGAMSGVVQLKNNSGGNLTITGGTEGGHMTHGVGKGILDLRKDDKLNSYILNNKTSQQSSSHGTIYKGKDGNTYLDEGDHWHVVFK